MQNDFRFLDYLSNYPPAIPRAKVSQFFPWLSQKRLANLDRLGQGPDGSFKNGRAVIYPTCNFLEWLDRRTSPLACRIKTEEQGSERCSLSVKRRGRKTKQQEIRERRL